MTRITVGLGSDPLVEGSDVLGAAASGMLGAGSLMVGSSPERAKLLGRRRDQVRSGTVTFNVLRC